jgi:general secretion pathway protein D
MFLRRIRSAAPVLGAFLLAAGCGTRPVMKSEGHITAEAPRPAAAASIPPPVRAAPLPPPPEARDPEIKYSVVVTNQPVREVLLAMARETKVNFDIHPGIEGTVNLNAIDQTLRQILNRMARQVDMRWEMEGQTITVMPDSPYLRSYRVNYVNMARDVSGTIGVQSQVVAPPGGTSSGGSYSAGAASGASQNTSLLKVDNVGRNRFWETLERNIKDLLRETDKLLPEGSSETFVQSRGQGAVSTTQSKTVAQARRSTSTQSGTTIETPAPRRRSRRRRPWSSASPSARWPRSS